MGVQRGTVVLFVLQQPQLRIVSIHMHVLPAQEAMWQRPAPRCAGLLF